VARHREFDFDRALERATLLFWKKGYSNTSVRELLKTMGIGEGSFYNTVKSKKDLYLQCLQHYNNTVSRRRLAALASGESVQEGVRAFFKTVLDELDDPATPRICLLAGSLAADVLRERDLKQAVVREMLGFVESFKSRLAEAKEEGQLAADFNADAAAQVLVTYLQGLFRVIGVLQNRSEVEGQVELLLVGLGL
jgi:TetR/AcrR family transcriptional repressor of nem operon